MWKLWAELIKFTRSSNSLNIKIKNWTKKNIWSGVKVLEDSTMVPHRSSNNMEASTRFSLTAGKNKDDGDLSLQVVWTRDLAAFVFSKNKQGRMLQEYVWVGLVWNLPFYFVRAGLITSEVWKWVWKTSPFCPPISSNKWILFQILYSDSKYPKHQLIFIAHAYSSPSTELSKSFPIRWVGGSW